MAESDVAKVISNAVNSVANKQNEESIKLLAKMIFAEDAQGGSSAWRGVGNVALNRLADGRYGSDLPTVVRRMSSAVRTNSPQWQIANNERRTPYETKVLQNIEKVVATLFEDRLDNTKGATLFENIEQYGFPKSWNRDKVKAVSKIGKHTYFKEL